MAEKKYGKYIKQLAFMDYGAGSLRQGTHLGGEEWDMDFSIDYGACWYAGKIEPFEKTLDVNRTMLFLGADTGSLGELGAEIELSLGEEQEKHMIATSAAVFAPAGFPHGPATCNKMDKRFIFMDIRCPKVVTEASPSRQFRPNMSGLKYHDHIINPPFIRKGPWHYGPQNRDDSGGYITSLRLKDFGFDFLMMYESIKKAPYRFGPIPDKPHVHPYHEVLLFIGTDTNDLTRLGAEVEMAMGKELERHMFDTPTAVVLPQGFPHCPLAITKLTSPFIFAVVRPFGGIDRPSSRLP